jgi:CRISPR-associated endonuclease/helicase Cas3
MSLLNDDLIAHVRESDGAVQGIEAHLAGVAALAGKNAEKLGLGKLGELLGLLHDVGKCGERFQNYIRSAEGLIDQDSDDYVDSASQRGKIDHSTAGAQWIWRSIPKDSKGFDVICAQMMALVLASHHSGMMDCVAPDGADIFSKRMEKPDEKTHLGEVMAKIPEDLLERVRNLRSDPALFDPLKKMLRVLMENEKKREASFSEHYSKSARTRCFFKIGLLLRMLFSCLIDADRTDTANFEFRRSAVIRRRDHYVNWQTLACRLETHLLTFGSGTPIDAERKKISDKCERAALSDKGIFTLTVPTGGGKTLASLRFALRHALHHGDIDRIFYIIPYTTIIDQNAEAVRKILEREDEKGDVVLECHSNMSPEHETWRGKILAETWNAPIVFTTSVQFLEALFAGGTRSARRMHQFARSVIIFDEIQTLPIRLVHMFCNALNFLADTCGTTVVLSTATQPMLGDVDEHLGSLLRDGVREIMSGGQLAPEALSEIFERFRRVDIVDMRRSQGFTYQEIAELVIDEQKIYGSVLVVANTTKSAREIYQRVKSTFAHTIHLSANMCPSHRKATLATIRARLSDSLPVVCVSTQVIEAGVDVDFGSGIRLLAGLDSIAQTAGRVNRHGLREKGRILIINPSEEKLGSLIDISKGRDIARRVLDEFGEKSGLVCAGLLDPEAMALYFKYYFHDRKNEMSYSVDIGRNDDLLNMLSANLYARHEYKRARGGTEYTDDRLSQSFASAAGEFRSIDSPGRGVIVPYGDGADIITRLCGSYKPERDFKLLREAQQYTVNIYPHIWEKLGDAIYKIQEGSDICCIRSEHYSLEFGLSVEPVSKLETSTA